MSAGTIDWPAWVQAVGSVAAILFAAYIANRQHREARTQLLTQKLDQFYFSLLDASDELAALYELAQGLRAGALAPEDRKLFADRIHRTRIDRLTRMYSAFYFPLLTEFTTPMFEANQLFAKQARAIARGDETAYDDFHAPWFTFDRTIQAVRKNIVDRQTDHVRASKWPRADASAV
jgi:hypothetical protein